MFLVQLTVRARRSGEEEANCKTKKRTLLTYFSFALFRSVPCTWMKVFLLSMV